MRVVENNPSQCLAIFRNVLVQIARKELYLADVEVFAGALRDVIEIAPVGVGVLAIVEEDAGAPQGPARDAMAKAAREAGAHIACSAVIIEGGGFQAAAKRGFAAGINWAIRRTFPHQIFSRVEEALPWFAKHVPPHTRIAMRASDLERALEELRR